MAFTEPTNQDLVTALQSPFQTQHGYNLLRRSTLGSTDLFREIAANASFSGAVLCTNSQSDSIGRLDIGASTPTLVKRYKLLEIIGEGTFSQIFKAEDIYSCKTVAIKVMRIGFHVLGMRESTFLRHFNGKELRGAQHFLKVLGAFRFQGHFCLALDLYDTTLLSMLYLPHMYPGTNHGSSGEVFNKAQFQPTIHQPRVVRHKYSRDLTAKIKIEDTEETKLRVLDIKKLTKIAATLTMALCLLRKEGAIHADIKPENCFIRTRGNISDEGTVKREGSDSSRAYCSTESSLIRHCSTSILLTDRRSGFLDDFDLQLGDFGNSIHMSDVGSYYTDFDLQTLSYRAPEVLLGVPFGYQIDIWSLGILLIEVCIGKPLFIVRSRKELYDAMCTHLTAPPRVRFAGGMYSDLLTHSESSGLEKFDFGPDTVTAAHPWNTANTKINYSEHLSNVKRLLDKHVADAPNDLVHYLAGLVNPDPDHRLTAMDAIRHPFVSASVISPQCMIGFTSAPSRVGAAAVGLKVLRSYSNRNDAMCPLARHFAKDVSTSRGVDVPPSSSSVEIVGNHTNTLKRTMVTGSSTALTPTDYEISEGDSCDKEYQPANDLDISNSLSKEKCLVSLPEQQQEQEQQEQQQEGERLLTNLFDFGSRDALRFQEENTNERRSKHSIVYGTDCAKVLEVSTVKQNIGRTFKNTSSSLASLPAPFPRPMQHISVENSDFKRKTNSYSFSRKTEENGGNHSEITRMKNHDFLRQSKDSTNGYEQCDKSVIHNCSVSTTVQKNHFYNEEYSIDNLFSQKKITDNKDLT